MIGSLGSNDGNGNENVTWKWTFGKLWTPSSYPLLMTEHAANGLVEAPMKKM